MIGVFDSGIGGLTVLKALKKKLPEYNYVYLADSARAPYGDKTKQEIYNYTAEAVDFLFKKGCQLVILACNTASALALRKIQKNYLPKFYPERKVLGIVVPNIETIACSLNNAHPHSCAAIGIIGTKATIKSKSYEKELKKICGQTKIYSRSCPMLVTIIENDEIKNKSTDAVLKKYLQPFINKKVSAVILACTHYTILSREMKKILGPKIKIIDTSASIALKTDDYLRRHPEIKRKLKTGGQTEYFTTGEGKDFKGKAEKILKKKIKVKSIILTSEAISA